MTSTAVLWFRRDLRLGDHPALRAAAERADRVLAVFVLDEALLRPAGAARRAFLTDCLRALNDQLGGRLLVVRGKPETALPELARQVDARAVCVSADFGPYGRQRDERVRVALAEHGVDWIAESSPYAVDPGEITKADGSPYRVFTPFRRAWSEHGCSLPEDTGRSTTRWHNIAGLGGVDIPDAPDPSIVDVPGAGEEAALRQWDDFVHNGLTYYHRERDRPDHSGASRMSAHLRWGCVHPRTLFARIGRRGDEGAIRYRDELIFREFYADVLLHWPDSARRNFDPRYDRMRVDTGDDARERFSLWCEGKTGFPMVDAGMRQLLREGWMHNRLRMIVASFLVKDLHLPWWWGARHFMRHLVDGDLASNQHNWQWVAGSGTDAAPYFRIFNPTTQGKRFDPDGDYVRRYVPELRGIAGAAVHDPDRWPELPEGYPAALVDHAHEREVALQRFGAIKDQPSA